MKHTLAPLCAQAGHASARYYGAGSSVTLCVRCCAVLQVQPHRPPPTPRPRWGNKRGGLNGRAALARVLGSATLRRMALHQMKDDELAAEWQHRLGRHQGRRRARRGELLLRMARLARDLLRG